jgi:Ca-activated chloride channel family protein
MYKLLILSSFLLTVNLCFGDDVGPLTVRRAHMAKATASANIRIDTNEVLVPVSVLDTFGRNVSGLARNNFRVFDGPDERPIISFGRDDAPVSIGIVFDCSRSMRPKYKTSHGAPAELFRQLNPRDEAFLITVSNRAELKQPFTSNFGNLLNKLVFIQPQGETALLDGIYMGLSMMKKAHNPRKALIVVSDGGDNNSRYTERELASLAMEANTQIYSICLWQHAASPEELAGPDLLEDIARESGGVVFPVAGLDELCAAMAKIGITMHNQYVLGYYPPENAPGGKFRKIKVQLLLPRGLPPVQVFARAGYFVPDR